MQPLDLIAGRFRLEAPIGVGGMGVVFLARDEAVDGRLIALKTLRPEASASSARFLREAEALAQLTSGVFVGHVAHGLSAAGEPYLALEWIDGPTLAARLAGAGVTPHEALLLALRVIEGLSELHARGIVHRDLKPSNLMLPGDDVRAVRILDLGIARIADASAELTADGAQLGTPRYMAPEQIRDPRSVDGRADVFALGCVLFECLTGTPAFAGDDPVTVLAQILFGRASDPSELRPELQDELDPLLRRLLSRSPQLRPNADAVLAAELSALLASPRLSALGAQPRGGAVTQVTRELVAATVATSESRPLDKSRVRDSAPPLLARAVRSSQPALLSRPARPLIGRERELNELGSWLERAEPISLWGGAGVGKTRLAIELGRLAITRGLVAEQAVLFCDLSSAQDSRDVVRMCAEQLGLANIAQVDAEDQAGRLFAKLGALLIILDRAEHLRRELEPLIALWTRHAPELSIVVTSRARLRVGREFALTPLTHRKDVLARFAGAASASQESSPPSAAAELVLHLAREAGQLHEPHDGATALSAEAIGAALEGNPLAIELALARLPLLGFRGILERLPEQLTLLGEQHSDKTMRRAIEWSWQLLGPAERAACMQASVFCAPFTPRAAEAVLVLPDGLSVLDCVQSLCEHSLLYAHSESAQAGARVALPTVVREFARQTLSAAAEHDAALAGVWQRHAAYALAVTRASAGEHTLASEDSIAAAEFSLSDRGPDVPRALELLLGLSRQLLAAGSGSRLSQLLERALERCHEPERAAAVPEPLVLAAHQLRARMLAPAGELTRAQRDLDYVRERASARGDTRLYAHASLELGVVRHFAGDLVQASALYEQAREALADFDGEDDAIAEARCLGNLGAVQHDRAELHAAAKGYRRALALLPAEGQERLVANFQGNLALVEHELGDKQTARRLYTQAAARLEALLDARLLGIVLGNFGSLALSEGRYDEASQHFTRAKALLEQSGDRRSEGLSLARLAVGLAQAGHVPEAEQHLARAERMLRKDEVARTVVRVLSGFIDLRHAQSAVEQGQMLGAAQHLQSAREKCAAGAALRGRSDDLRLYLALLEPAVVQAAARIAAAPPR